MSDESELGGGASAGQISAAMKTLHVAMGHARLYGAEHRETTRTMEEALHQLGPVLATHGRIDLAGSPEGLHWHGENIHPETEEFVGLGRLLHREGIARLSLEQGLEVEELGRLLEVLRVNFELPQYEEETLESLLWQASLDSVEFQAVAALMEAEALSGQIAAPAPRLDMEGRLRRIMELRVTEFPNEALRRNFGQLSEEVVTSAVAASDLAGLGPGDEGFEGLEEGRSWKVRFTEEGSEDAEEIAVMRASVEANSHPAALVELVGVLMRAVLADRSELPAAEALGMARLSVEELYRQGDPVALVHLLDLGSELISEPRTQSSQRSGTVRDFFATAVGPREITRVLLALDPSQTQASSELGRLVGRLPDAVLQSVLEVAARDPDSERGRALQSTLGQVVGDRVNGWLQNAALQSPERVLPTLALARSLGSEVAERTRPSLLTHPARLVREEVLRWYRDSLPAEDLKLLLPLTVDPAPSVRREVCEVLKAHRPYEAVSWLRRLVSAESFGRRAPEIKRDVCVIFALLGGDGAVETLEKLLDREPGKGADRAGYLADLEAAATGIAAVGSVQARQTLKRRSGGFFGGARKKACAAALKHFDDMGNL